MKIFAQNDNVSIYHKSVRVPGPFFQFVPLRIFFKKKKRVLGWVLKCKSARSEIPNSTTPRHCKQNSHPLRPPCNLKKNLKCEINLQKISALVMNLSCTIIAMLEPQVSVSPYRLSSSLPSLNLSQPFSGCGPIPACVSMQMQSKLVSNSSLPPPIPSRASTSKATCSLQPLHSLTV